MSVFSPVSSPTSPRCLSLLIHLNRVSFCSICIQMAVRGIYGNNISAFIIVYLVTCANFQKMNLSSILAKERVKHQPLHGYKAVNSQTNIPINDFLAQLLYLCLLFQMAHLIHFLADIFCFSFLLCKGGNKNYPSLDHTGISFFFVFSSEIQVY